MPDQGNDIKGGILKRLIAAGKKHREEFISTGKEIERYGYSKDYDFEYQGKFAQNADIFFKAKVAKTAQAIEVFGPYLYPSNPTRRVEVRPWASEQSALRAELMGNLLNYLPDETDLYSHARRAVNQAITFGRGVMWTGYNPEKQIVQSIYDTVENLLVDPDAFTWEQVNWVARRRRMARWAAMKRYPEAKEVLGQLSKAGDRKSDGSSVEDPMSEMIELYEVYAKVGLANYKGGSDLVAPDEENPQQGVIDDSPKKYVVTGDGKIVSEGTWEVPWFRDGEWPCTILDFRDVPDNIWPVSPLQTGMGHQKALNWIYSLYLSKLRYTTRSLIGVMKNSPLGGLSEESVTEALYGGELPVIEFSVAGAGGENVKLSDFIQQFNFQDGMAEFERASSIINREYEMATGLYDVLQFGEGRTQDRSAAATNLKKEASTTRVNDMKSRVEQWMSRLARKEAMAARFLMGPAEIARIFGPEVAQVWGEILDPKVDFDSFFLETDYTIESGSMQRKTPEQAQDATEAALNQALPALLQAGAVRSALAIVGAWAKAWNQPKDVQDAVAADLAQLMAPPAPPMPGEAPAAPGEMPIGAGQPAPGVLPPMGDELAFPLNHV